MEISGEKMQNLVSSAQIYSENTLWPLFQFKTNLDLLDYFTVKQSLSTNACFVTKITSLWRITTWTERNRQGGCKEGEQQKRMHCCQGGWNNTVGRHSYESRFIERENTLISWPCDLPFLVFKLAQVFQGRVNKVFVFRDFRERGQSYDMLSQFSF